MSPTLTTFLFEAANFLVLAAVLAWLFFKPVRDAIDRRRDGLQQQADDTAAELAAAQQLRTELQQERSGLDQELADLRADAHATAEAHAAQILKTARDAAHRESDMARHRLAHLERAQRQRLARIVAEAVGATVDHLLRCIDQPDLDHAFTTAACRQIQAFDGNSLAPVRVESAHALSEDDRCALLEVLGQSGESAEFHVIEDLGTGLRVATNRGLIDVSSAGLSTFAERQLHSQLASDSESSEKDSADA